MSLENNKRKHNRNTRFPLGSVMFVRATKGFEPERWAGKLAGRIPGLDTCYFEFHHLYVVLCWASHSTIGEPVSSLANGTACLSLSDSPCVELCPGPGESSRTFYTHPLLVPHWSHITPTWSWDPSLGPVQDLRKGLHRDCPRCLSLALGFLPELRLAHNLDLSLSDYIKLGLCTKLAPALPSHPDSAAWQIPAPGERSLGISTNSSWGPTSTLLIS